MKAAVFLAPKSIEIQYSNIPSINNDEILVKVVASGISGTDVKIYNGGKKVEKLAEEVSFEEGALAEPVAACINGNKKLRQEKGSMLWIIGDGPIGLIHIQLSKLIGIEKIILSGTDDEKLLTGRNLGADYTINVLQEDVKEKISDITKGEGVSQ